MEGSGRMVKPEGGSKHLGLKGGTASPKGCEHDKHPH